VQEPTIFLHIYSSAGVINLTLTNSCLRTAIRATVQMILCCPAITVFFMKAIGPS